jgi:NAD(P)-dependent dehydrogenase (short-subunit alcohol dehydrogenase family)
MSGAALQDRVAVVTGGGSGIGRAIAHRFAVAGARVVVAGRGEGAIGAVAAETGGLAVACDVTRLDEVEALFARAQEWGGGCDVLVNNAGQTGPVGALAEVDLDAWRQCIEVNLFGAMHCLRVAARIMGGQGRGSIINMSSRMGLHGYPMRTAYSATKFALIGMTEAVAREVGPRGVRVNALCPGAVSGELMERVIAARAAASVMRRRRSSAATTPTAPRCAAGSRRRKWRRPRCSSLPMRHPPSPASASGWIAAGSDARARRHPHPRLQPCHRGALLHGAGRAARRRRHQGGGTGRRLHAEPRRRRCAAPHRHG